MKKDNALNYVNHNHIVDCDTDLLIKIKMDIDKELIYRQEQGEFDESYGEGL